MFEDITNAKTIKSFRAKGTRSTPAYHDVKGFRDVYGSTAKVVSVFVENTEEPVLFGRIDEVFEPNFFNDWHLHSHGKKGLNAPCHNREYKKRNYLYCKKKISDFRFDRLGIGMR